MSEMQLMPHRTRDLVVAAAEATIVAAVVAAVVVEVATVVGFVVLVLAVLSYVGV